MSKLTKNRFFMAFLMLLILTILLFVFYEAFGINPGGQSILYSDIDIREARINASKDPNDLNNPPFFNITPERSLVCGVGGPEVDSFVYYFHGWGHLNILSPVIFPDEDYYFPDLELSFNEKECIGVSRLGLQIRK